MKLLKEIHDRDVPLLKKTESRPGKLFKRISARAVVFDADSNIALMYDTVHGYHKLPGGGIQRGEERHEACERECLEETGCRIEILDEVGKIIEHRKYSNQHQTSYCYLARVKGAKGPPRFSEEEQRRGFKIQWVPIKDVMSILKNDKPDGNWGKFAIVRAQTFLREAKLIIERQRKRNGSV